VPGAVLLVAGEPGVGKSTLLLEVAHRVAASNGPALVVSGEESAAQVRLRPSASAPARPALPRRGDRAVGRPGPRRGRRPSLLVLDSVQTVRSPAVEGTDGGSTQVRAVASALTAVAKSRGMTAILVGHVTKDGAIAGPRTLEHLVDVVVSFDGERHSTLRLIRAMKNRFGPADEIGCFEIGDNGVVGVPDPSHLFVSRRTAPVPGSCVTVTLEGSRPLLAEVQALVASTSGGGSPAPGGQRVGQPRVAMVNAVVERRGGVRLADFDVFAASVGGVRIAEPARRPSRCTGDRLGGPGHPAARRHDRPRRGGPVRRDPPGRRHGTAAGRGGPGRATRWRWCPRMPEAPPDGMRLVEVPDLGAALRPVVSSSQEICHGEVG
jgi:DNA repair protein RadA/Sms